jgi:DNA (cytosine-5)-methyltransferase 1
MEKQLRSPHTVIRSNNLNTCRGARVRLPPKLQGEEGEAAWHRAVTASDALVAIDLFCGAGGLSYGFQEAGFVSALGIDSNADACETHAANLLSRTLCQNIQTIEHPEALMKELGIPCVDVVIGGPPCQGFSLVGRGKVKSLSKEVRDRIYNQNYLYREFVRFVQSLRPLFFVMENVPHLSSFADGVIAQAMAEDFDALGYNIYHELLEAAHYGVPQTRRRLFIIGTRIGWVYRKPRITHGDARSVRTLANAIADLPPVQAPSLVEELPYSPSRRPDVDVSGEYAMLMRSALPSSYQGIIFDHVVRPVREDDAIIFRSMKHGDRYRDVDPRYRRYDLTRAQRDGRYQFADRYYKLPWDRPCVTITAHIANDGYRYIHPDSDQPRTLSVREAARIQSFPDHFRFAGYRTNRFRQVGNAVPPLLGEAIAQSLARAIREYRRGESKEHEWQPFLPGLNKVLVVP